jgi:hypothetical protein
MVNPGTPIRGWTEDRGQRNKKKKQEILLPIPVYARPLSFLKSFFASVVGGWVAWFWTKARPIQKQKDFKRKTSQVSGVNNSERRRSRNGWYTCQRFLK